MAIDADILSQLVQIKWLLVVFVAVTLLNTIFRTWVDLRKSGGLRRMLRDTFEREARALLDAGRYPELLVLARARCEDVPGDAWAFWYHAIAAHRVGDNDTALRCIRKAGELQPDWRESHVEPFIRAIAQEEPHVDTAAPPKVSPPLH
jgi:uncharacterized protein HemY